MSETRSRRKEGRATYHCAKAAPRSARECWGPGALGTSLGARAPLVKCGRRCRPLCGWAVSITRLEQGLLGCHTGGLGDRNASAHSPEAGSPVSRGRQGGSSQGLRERICSRLSALRPEPSWTSEWPSPCPHVVRPLSCRSLSCGVLFIRIPVLSNSLSHSGMSSLS